MKLLGTLLCTMISLTAIAKDAPLDIRGERNYRFADSLLSNEAEFQSDFFRGFPLYKKEMKIDGKLTRNYNFPTLYGDVTNAVAVFICSFEEAQKLMPDPSMTPIDAGNGRSVVILSSYRYKKVLGIAPYNEVAVTIPVGVGKKATIQDLPDFARAADGLGYYVASMPVTTLENQIRGTQLWGLPKVVQEINLSVKDDWYTTSVLQEDGTEYLSFSVPIKGKESELVQKTSLYSNLKGTPVRSESNLKGSFVSTTFVPPFAASEVPFLKLGNSPSGQFLKRLKIVPHPIEVRFGQGVSSTFDLPK